MKRLGPVQQKTLLILLGIITLGGPRTIVQQARLFSELRKEWKKIDKRGMNRSLTRLSEQKLVTEKILPDGSVIFMLTAEGNRIACSLNLFGPSIRLKRPKVWDGKWRVVAFDIPERSRSFRAILREHLHEAEFYQLQQSVFVSPYPYEKAFAELIRLYEADPFVRIMTVSWMDNEADLKHIFFGRRRSRSQG
jgi:DNA-binding transcriptional regulator PaaX